MPSEVPESLPIAEVVLIAVDDEVNDVVLDVREELDVLVSPKPPGMSPVPVALLMVRVDVRVLVRVVVSESSEEVLSVSSHS